MKSTGNNNNNNNNKVIRSRSPMSNTGRSSGSNSKQVEELVGSWFDDGEDRENAKGVIETLAKLALNSKEKHQQLDTMLESSGNGSGPLESLVSGLGSSHSRTAFVRNVGDMVKLFDTTMLYPLKSLNEAGLVASLVGILMGDPMYDSVHRKIKILTEVPVLMNYKNAARKSPLANSTSNHLFLDMVVEWDSDSALLVETKYVRLPYVRGDPSLESAEFRNMRNDPDLYERARRIVEEMGENSVRLSLYAGRKTSKASKAVTLSDYLSGGVASDGSIELSLSEYLESCQEKLEKRYAPLYFAKNHTRTNIYLLTVVGYGSRVATKLTKFTQKTTSSGVAKAAATTTTTTNFGNLEGISPKRNPDINTLLVDPVSEMAMRQVVLDASLRDFDPSTPYSNIVQKGPITEESIATLVKRADEALRYVINTTLFTIKSGLNSVGLESLLLSLLCSDENARSRGALKTRIPLKSSKVANATLHSSIEVNRGSDQAPLLIFAKYVPMLMVSIDSIRKNAAFQKIEADRDAMATIMEEMDKMDRKSLWVRDENQKSRSVHLASYCAFLGEMVASDFLDSYRSENLSARLYGVYTLCIVAVGNRLVHELRYIPPTS